MNMSLSSSLLILFSLIAAVGLAVLAPELIRSRRRKTLMAAPLPQHMRETLENNVPLYATLPSELRRQLPGLVNVFLHEKDFEGCGGLGMTDEIRVTIATQACILMLGRKPRFYPELTTILVYPGTYFVEGIRRIGPQFVKEETARLGESWTGGTIVLAWDHVDKGVMDFTEGHNVVLHEFAHQLDLEDGYYNGVPLLDSSVRHSDWARVFNAEFERLKKESILGLRDVIDDYGTLNPAEFFAVAVEAFFEIPWELKEKHAELYAMLEKYFKVSPADWSAAD